MARLTDEGEKKRKKELEAMKQIKVYRYVKYSEKFEYEK
jgi:hypothetical protein